jgi:hypothetical protein
MSNMSYCRFENTYDDLIDCANHMEDDNLSTSEKKYRKLMIELCKEMSEFETETSDDVA